LLTGTPIDNAHCIYILNVCLPKLNIDLG